MTYLSHSKDFQGVPDIFLSDPKRYHPFMQLLETLMNGPSDLTRPEREMIALLVSALNDCHYCVGSHQAVLRAHNIDNALIDGLGSGSAVGAEDKLGAALEFTRKLTLTPGGIGQGDIDAMRAAGWSDQAIEDVMGVVSAFAFLNRLVDGYGVMGSEAGFEQSGKMVAEHGYGPLTQMVGQKAAEAA
jgi:uncharacterized peroxidase-related enzyme